MTIENVDPKFIDLDLTAPPGLGKGLLEDEDRENQLMAATESFAAARPGQMVERSEWRARCEALAQQYRDDVQQIYDQGSNGSCVGFASAQMLEVTLVRRYGRKNWVSLSGMSSYKRIGRSASSGAMVPDGMDTVIEGLLPADTPENKARFEHTHNFRNFSAPLPQGWRETAKLFRGQRFVVARGIDEIMSALINGYLGIVGRNGHSVPYVYGTFRGNSPLAAYANSWRPSWGDQGFGYDSENLLRNMTCWILLDVATRPDLDIPEA